VVRFAPGGLGGDFDGVGGFVETGRMTRFWLTLAGCAVRLGRHLPDKIEGDDLS